MINFGRREMGRLLPDDRPRSIEISNALDAASLSCSYAAPWPLKSVATLEHSDLNESLGIPKRRESACKPALNKAP